MRDVSVRAPGRVNLIGDHTDYNDGFVLPLAIDRECRVVGHASDTLALRWVQGGDGNSLRIAEAVRAALGLPDTGLDAEVSSTVPIGSGLSSSSAFAVALAHAFLAAAGVERAPEDVARACQEAETAATGVPGGIMDQLTSVRGRAGCALLIDCRTLDVSPVRLPAGVHVLVADSGVPRRLAASAYAERRAHCESVARRLGVPALRDASAEQVADDPRARHVVSENARVLAAADARARCDRRAPDGCRRNRGEAHGRRLRRLCRRARRVGHLGPDRRRLRRARRGRCGLYVWMITSRSSVSSRTA